MKLFNFKIRNGILKKYRGAGGDVTIPNRVTSIGDEAFRGCEGLTSVVIPDSVTSIGNYAFLGCKRMKRIVIPDGITSIGDGAFLSCISLTEISAHKNNAYFCSENGVLFNETKTKLICYPAGKTETSYSIPDSVTSIGTHAFWGCKNLKSVVIPDSVTSIGDGAFVNCISLTEISVNENNAHFCLENGVLFNKTKTKLICYPTGKTETSYSIPDSVTSIGYGAFIVCENLTSVVIPDSVTSIGYGVFMGCKNLKSVVIPDSVTSIGDRAFWLCKNLTSVVIPDSVTSIGEEAFCDCRLMRIQFTGTRAQWKAISKGTHWNYNAYNYTKNLYTVYCTDGTVSKKGVFEPNGTEGTQGLKFISNGNGTCTLTDIGTCADRDIVIPSTNNGDSVTSIGNYAFHGCEGLTSVVIPNSVTRIGKGVFNGCFNLTIVQFTGTMAQWKAISLITGAIVYCTDGTFSMGRFTYGIGLKFTSNGNGTCTLTGIGTCIDRDIVIPSTNNGDSVTSIGDNAFHNCHRLNNVIIPDSVTSIGNDAFSGCDILTSVVIPNSVTSIGKYAFIGCKNLTSVVIPDSVTSISDWTFVGCNSLKGISVHKNNAYFCSENGVLFNKAKTELICYPAGKTGASYSISDSVTSIGACAFEHTGLTSVVIPDSVTSIGNYAFWNCENLTSIVIPDSVTSIGKYAFRNCRRLTEISVHKNNAYYYSENGVLFNKAKTELICYPAGKTETSYSIPASVTSIGNYAFWNCKNLTSIVIPDSVTSIGKYAFIGCKNLTSITIPDSVTSIGDGAFWDCKNLTSIVIPDSVTSIDNAAFYDCSSLTNIQFTGTTAQWKAIIFGDDWNFNTGNYTVTCTDGTVSKDGVVAYN